MFDPQLHALVIALDRAPVRPAAVPGHSLAVAEARLAAARAVLGTVVAESPYLGFARHLAPRTADAVAVSA
jgi:hypothetical protein